METRTNQYEAGFTLIELFVVISVIGVLAAISLSSFKVYRASAQYSVADQTLGFAKRALEAGVVGQEDDIPAVGLTSQSASGSIQNNQASELLPGMLLPNNVELKVMHDPDCSGCTKDMLEVQHCSAKQLARWVRFDDGVEVTLDKVAGGGCS